MYGYASSPIAFRDTVIVPVGGSGKAVMAFRQSDGTVAWSKNNYGNVYSSPILIDVSGLEQLALVMDGAVIGVNPHNGDLQWQVPFKADYSIAVATPVWGPGNLLFVSSEYNAGSKSDRTQAERTADDRHRAVEFQPSPAASRKRDANWRRDLFFKRRQGQPGDSECGRCAPGKIHWQERSIEKATFVWADQKLITLDQDGNLMIAHPSPQGFKIAAKAPLLTHLSWTPPVLVGTRLFIRDRKTLMAVDLG